MKVVGVLVIVASFVAFSEAQGDLYSMMVLSNLFGGGNESPGRSASYQGLPRMGSGETAGSAGSAGSAGGNAAAYGRAAAMAGRGGRGYGRGGGNGFMQLGAISGQFGDLMQDFSMCNMFRGYTRRMCQMSAMTGGGMF